MPSARHRSRSAATRVLCLALSLAAVSAPVGGAEPLAPGPLAVRLVTVGEDGKPTPVPHAYFSLGGRRASTDAAGVATVDGLPAGRHDLDVRHPRFEAVTRTVEVPPGPRTALEVQLAPVARVYWGGRVLAEGVLHVHRVNVEAASDHHILEAILQVQKTALVEKASVAGMQPAVN